MLSVGEIERLRERVRAAANWADPKDLLAEVDGVLEGLVAEDGEATRLEAANEAAEALAEEMDSRKNEVEELLHAVRISIERADAMLAGIRDSCGELESGIKKLRELMEK